MEEQAQPEAPARDLQEQNALAAEHANQQLDSGDVTGAVATLADLHPADRADVFWMLERSARKALYPHLSHIQLGEIFSHLDLEQATAIASEIEPQELSRVLDEAGADVAADVLLEMPPAEAAQTLRSMLEAERVTPLLLYPQESVGGLMTTEYVAMRGTMSASEGLEWLRSFQPREEVIRDLFVVDSEDYLLGAITLPQLVLADPDTKVAELMDSDAPAVRAEADREEAARVMQHYQLLTLPVVDADHRLIGIVTAENVPEVIEAEATEDMYRMVGLQEEERVFSPVTESVRRRLPWLMVNLATAVLASAVVSLFQGTIAQLALLAVFMPMVAGQGGNAGTQALTIIVRGLALGELEVRDAWRVLRKEGLLGFVNGAAVGIVAGSLAWIWSDKPMLGLVVFLAMTLNMVAAGLAGALVPLGLRLLHIDPALASAIFVTTVTDVCGFFFYLGIATLLIVLLV